MKVPITRVEFGEETVKEAGEVIRSGWIAQGPRVKEFEEAVASVVGSRFAVCLSSGTAALHLSLLAEGIGPGDEVIVPSFSFIATANAVLYTGAVPVFCDIDGDTYNIDPEKIEALITDKTKAVMPVHQFGLPCDMDRICGIAAKKGIKVIEDAACALGASYKGRKIGKTDSCASFSFHPRKVTTSAEGGMVTTDNSRIADALYKMRNHGDVSFGLSKKEDAVFPYFYDGLGFNYRMTDIQAVLGIHQTRNLESYVKRRNEIAILYNDAFGNIDALSLPIIPSEGTICNFQSYLIKINDTEKFSRDKVVETLLAAGIGTKAGIPPIHMQQFYIDRAGKYSLPVTEKLALSTFFIPVFPSMADEELEYVINSVQEIFTGR